MEARNARLWVAWVWLAASQVPFCVCFVLYPRQATRARHAHKAAEFYRSAAVPQMLCSSLQNLNPLLSRRPPHLRSQPAAGVVSAGAKRRKTEHLLPSARRGGRTSAVTSLSGVIDDTSDSGDGGVTIDNSHSSSTSNSTRTGEATGDETAAAAATVRAETKRLMSVPTIDIKLELQMRGVEHRDTFEKVDLARRLAEARVSSPSPPAATGGATTGPGADDRVDNARAGAKETAEENKAPSTTTVDDAFGAATPAAEEGRSHSAAPEGGGSAAYPRDVARATRMGKAAIVRELNAMGVAHSRLSDVSVLARQYATGREQAREDAERARRMPRAARPLGEGSTAGGSQGGGSGWRGSEEEEGEPRGDVRGQRGPGASDLPWDVDREEEDEENDEEETDNTSGTFTNGVGGRRNSWDVAGDRGTETPFSDNGGAEGDEHETSWSVRANAGSVPSSSSSAGGAGGVDKKRSRTASLHARADRMSSRELMKALDDLGTRYRIPAPRSELQQAFVSAVLAQDGGSRSGAAAGKGGIGGRDSGDIVPLSPYTTSETDTEGMDGQGSRHKRRAGFGTYHSALQWARQLTFDDVLEELKYRGVAFDPRADFSYLTRVLADEVLADEELMEAEGAEGAYAAELETAMAMTAQELISDLRAGGEKVDVTLTKEALAEKLAEMNLRLRGSSPPPESASSDPYQRQTLPRDRRRGTVADDTRRRGRRGSAHPPPGLEAGAGGDDVLLELEEAARSVGGAALHVARETAAFVAETTAGFFPETFPANGAVGTRGRASTPEEQQQYHRRRTRMGGQAGGADAGDGDGGVDDVEGAQRARAVRERATGVRRAASGFAQSSVNRAGFAVAQSLANGLLRSAEAAADWAGDGALAREYVLLFIAAFCLVFKRGFGAAVALLVVIRFGRSAAQKLVLEGWKMERANKRRGGGGGVSAAASAAAGGATNSAGRDRPSARYAATRTTGRRPRRGRVVEVEAEERRRPRRKTGRAKRSSGRARRSKRQARRPLWDSESDDDNRGCVLM